MRLLCVCVLLWRGHDGSVALATEARAEDGREQRGPVFPLKVHVVEVLSGRSLSQASVALYSNYTRTASALTGGDGSVSLGVPHHAALPTVIMAELDGYAPALLPCAPALLPMFSSVSLSLQRLSPSNIWMFEDSVLITGRTSGPASPPAVSFHRSLLNVNASSVISYLSVPERVGGVNATGIISTGSGFVSVGIVPVTAVSIQLFSGDAKLKVEGPVQVSLRLPDSCGLQGTNAVPAWFLNSTTGGWMRKGLGTVTSVDGRLLWTFTAPHLGHWMAASLSFTPGFFGYTIDFLVHHWFVLLVLMGGLLFTALCLLGIIHHCRSSSKAPPPTMRNQDQSTSTSDHKHPQEGTTGSDTQNQYFSARCGNAPSELNISVKELPSAPPPVGVPLCPTDTLFFYNQPVALLHSPAFFHLEEEQEVAWGHSATLPRAGAGASFTQTLPSPRPDPQCPAVEADASQGAPGVPGSPRGLPESASVPVTLHRVADGSRPPRTPPPRPARAWFVSLEGKPAAEMRYAVSEQQRRRRPAECRDTSLDSGVDLSELSHAPGRRPAALEGKRSKHAP